MHRMAFYDAKSYDRQFFDALNPGYEIVYLETKLNARSARLAEGCDAVCAFVNDTVDAAAVETLYRLGVRVLALGGFADALGDQRQKQLMWARLKQIPPLGEPF